MRNFLKSLVSPALFFLVVILLGFLMSIGGPGVKHYHVGDCFDIGEKIYQVKEVGRYSIKAKTPHYEGFEEDLIDQNQIDKSVPVDCFDYFQIKDKQ